MFLGAYHVAMWQFVALMWALMLFQQENFSDRLMKISGRDMETMAAMADTVEIAAEKIDEYKKKLDKYKDKHGSLET